MRRIALVFCLMALFTSQLFAQSWESVKADDTYIWGEGYGTSVSEADQAALQDLISKIAVHVSSDVSQHSNQVISGDKLDESSSFSSKISTYSQATLNNTHKLIIQNEPDAHVGRYVKRFEIEKIFESRIMKLKDYAESAQKAEKQGKIDDALKYYYWAHTLLKSVQKPNEVTFFDANGDSRILINWIPEQMNDIFSSLKASVVKRDGENVDIFFTYKGKPVSSIDYTYFDGRDWSNIYSAKDGCGSLELAPGNISSQYKIRYEYEYYGESRIDPETESVLKTFKGTSLKKAYFDVQSDVVAKPANTNVGPKTETAISSTFAEHTENVVLPTKSQNWESLDKTVQTVISSIKAKSASNDIKVLFTDNGWDIYTKLIRYGNARIMGKPDMMYYDYEDGAIARGLQMSFSFKNGVRKSFVEDLVFTFDSNAKIDNISFGLGKTAETDILYRGAWPEHTRIAVMNFLENYKTAYALKRLDYISDIFDDDAIIIVGSVLRRNSSPKSVSNTDGKIDISLGGRDIIKYNRYTKDAYLKNLEKSFSTNEFINIRFSDNDVRKMKKGGELYAIQIQQDYYSSSYNDKGYLFLEVDINDPKKPFIILRTWQPNKDPNFGIYGPGDF